jgi:hypothetical protein
MHVGEKLVLMRPLLSLYEKSAASQIAVMPYRLQIGQAWRLCSGGGSRTRSRTSVNNSARAASGDNNFGLSSSDFDLPARELFGDSWDFDIMEHLTFLTGEKKIAKLASGAS